MQTQQQFSSFSSAFSHVDYGGKGTVVLLLHGLGSRGIDWQPQIEALKNQFRVITIDFPGHGNSIASAETITMKTLAKGVKLVLDQLEINAVHLVGLSLGGMVGFQFAIDYPSTLQSMIIINSGPGLGKRNAKLKRQLLLRKLILRCFGLKPLANKIAKNLFPAPTQAHLRGQFLQSIGCVDGGTYRRMVDAIGEFDITEEIVGCSVPTLILAADQDYTSVALKQNYANKMAKAEVCVIANSRHASPLDSPDFCNSKIIEFLQNLQCQAQ